MKMANSNHCRRCLYISSATIIIYFMLVYIWHTSNNGLSDIHSAFATAEQSTNKDSCVNDPIVFTDYAKFHKQSLVRGHEGKFLIYTCHRQGPCGGYGNRIQGITMALLFAIISNRTFLIDMTHPFNINRLLHPNAIKWNYNGYRKIKGLTTRNFHLMGAEIKKNWPSLFEGFFNPNINIIRVYANLGFPLYFDVFDDEWSQLLRDQFRITKHNYLWIYGYVIQYLFTYDKIVTDAIQKEIRELGLIPGLYVSVHFRSYLDAPKYKHPSPDPFLNHGIKIANTMSKSLNKDFKVYLVTDSHKAKQTAIAKYHGQVLPSNVKEVHVDKFRKPPSYNYLLKGFIGVIVNIEVAAKGAAFVRSFSTFSDLIESIGQFNNESVFFIKY